MHLVMEVRDAAELFGGRFALGGGMGWHKDGFDSIGVEFKARPTRCDPWLPWLHKVEG